MTHDSRNFPNVLTPQNRSKFPKTFIFRELLKTEKSMLYEKCIVVVSSPNYTDINCLELNCFACQMPTKNIFSLRGNIPTNMERYYYVSFTSKEIEIRGVKGTQCSWINNTWNFGSDLKQVNNFEPNLPPVGLHQWNDGKKIKIYSV